MDISLLFTATFQGKGFGTNAPATCASSPFGVSVAVPGGDQCIVCHTKALFLHPFFLFFLILFCISSGSIGQALWAAVQAEEEEEDFVCALFPVVWHTLHGDPVFRYHEKRIEG